MKNCETGSVALLLATSKEDTTAFFTMGTGTAAIWPQLGFRSLIETLMREKMFQIESQEKYHLEVFPPNNAFETLIQTRNFGVRIGI